ncbi:hypothetical protein NU09_1393 [Flavobacterium beibuense]|uniref:Uncharacterized protein n=1 Tax=Flavobacterium beibuense TaxID=657326 RepID=A0A444WDL8_9FLAO|nr:hypothetical protein NU09_1393 [Flavobacterium beibuense]
MLKKIFIKTQRLVDLINIKEPSNIVSLFVLLATKVIKKATLQRGSL